MSNRPANHRQRLKRRRAKNRAIARPKPAPPINPAAGLLFSLVAPITAKAWSEALAEVKGRS
jgi:hypothetical protein